MAQPKTDTLLQNILSAGNSDIVTQVMQNSQAYRLQIIYTRIDRDKKNKPVFTNYYYHYDPNLYFNPASTVKMPLAFLSLEKLNKMKVKDVNKFTFMQFDSSYEKQTRLYFTSAPGQFCRSLHAL